MITAWSFMLLKYCDLGIKSFAVLSIYYTYPTNLLYEAHLVCSEIVGLASPKISGNSFVCSQQECNEVIPTVGD